MGYEVPYGDSNQGSEDRPLRPVGVHTPVFEIPKVRGLPSCGCAVQLSTLRCDSRYFRELDHSLSEGWVKPSRCWRNTHFLWAVHSGPGCDRRGYLKGDK